MVEYTDYFDGWIDGKDEAYKDLQAMFKRADEGFGLRTETKPGEPSNGADKEDEENESIDSIKEYFDDNIAKIDALWNTTYSDGELRKMACLTKGNILLRKGQYHGERFFASQNYYQQACVVLEQCYDPEGKDFLNLMIRLNLGKYFRNMGKHNQRSDYRRALDEFEDIIIKIGDFPEPESWQEHIRLETMVNIGRTHRHLYHLKKAKVTLFETIAEILVHMGKYIKINKELDRYIEEKKKCRYLEEKKWRKKKETEAVIDDRDREKQDPEKTESKLYRYYLLQALVQLSIVFQKSREYETSFDICVAALNIDADNVDAANNLAVCLRKMDIKVPAKEWIKQRQEQSGKQGEQQEEPENEKKTAQEEVEKDKKDQRYFDLDYKTIFETLRKQKNRFATLHSIKCNMDEMDTSRDTDRRKIRKAIDKLLMTNPEDQEVLLLEGLYYQKIGDFEKSQKILKELYERSHQLAKGTIGLKAYYNMADNLLRQNICHEAKKYYERIAEEFRKIDHTEDNIKKKELTRWNNVLAVPPEIDLLAEIARGWCLMNLGDYESAEQCYTRLLKLYGGMSETIRTENRMRIGNNLAECLLYLAACSEKDEDREVDEERLKKAYKYLDDICHEEPNNATANRHLGYYYMLRAQKDGTASKEELEKALDHLKRAELYSVEDVYVYAGWVSAATQLLSKEEKNVKERSQHIENRLKYSSGVYSIKTCAKLAEYIMQLEKSYSNDGGRNDEKKEEDENNLKTMYRSLARIRLSKEEEGYGMFQRFKENEIFRRLKAEKRGELLVGLFRLYEQIIKIKDLCRFVPDVKDQGSGWLPVHYTKIDTLKKLLPGDDSSSGRLRLWNTVYMNDTFEGNSFIEMMKHAGKVRIKREQDSATGYRESDLERRVMGMMKNYFPYLNSAASEREPLVPINENIYVTSFSQEENGIYMWIPYGDDAKGCTITFEEDFFDIRKTKDALTDVAAYSDEDYPLYEIQYLSEDDLSSSGNKENTITKILDIMDKIWEILDDLESRLKGEVGLKKKECGQKEIALVRGLIADCLNEVRFLIKSSEYHYEREVRMLHYSYGPKMETENFDIPRLYVDVDRDIRIKEIKLGPKISEFETNEIVSWLTKTGKVGYITKSGRHYK